MNGRRTAWSIIGAACLIVAVLLIVLGLFIGLVAALEHGIHEVLPFRDLATMLVFLLPGILLWFLGGYLWSRSNEPGAAGQGGSQARDVRHPP